MVKGLDVQLALRRPAVRRERVECGLLIDPLAHVVMRGGHSASIAAS